MDDIVLEVLVRKTNDTNNKSEGALHFWMFRYAMQASRTMLCDICCILNSIQITGSRGQFCNHAPDVLQAQKANKPEHVHCKKSCPEMPPMMSVCVSLRLYVIARIVCGWGVAQNK